MPRLVPPLVRLVLCLAATAIAAPAAVPPVPAAPPNIIVIMSDDHAWQAISAYGDKRELIKTPHIDRLAHEGMRFDRYLVTNPLCGPSRACILTGTYNHINGFTNNTTSVFDGTQPTFPQLLHAAGYQTAMIGKWHLESAPTGFDFWQILPGQGVYYNPPMIRNGQTIQQHGYVTDIITDLSLDWLAQRDPSKPFLLLCWHKAPHREWEPALRHLAADGDRHYDEPPTLFDDYSGRGPAEHQQDMTIAHTLTASDLKLTPRRRGFDAGQQKAWDAYYGPRNAAFAAAHLSSDALVRWKYQRYMHDYLGCIRAVDESVGRVLDYLDRTGLASNTIVVYTSDQGFYLGEHGWFDKRWIFEESARTPLLVRWPGVTAPGSTTAALATNVDLAETFLEAAHQPVPSRMQGASLLPLLRGSVPADWRRAVYFEYYEYPAWHRVQPHEGVITDRYKFVRYFGPNPPGDELFDRATDPLELRSVAGDAAHAPIQAELESELRRLRRDLQVPDHPAADAFGAPVQFPDR